MKIEIVVDPITLPTQSLASRVAPAPVVAGATEGARYVTSFPIRTMGLIPFLDVVELRSVAPVVDVEGVVLEEGKRLRGPRRVLPTSMQRWR